MILNSDEKIIIKAAHEAGKIIMAGFGKTMTTHQKTTSGDFYIQIDIDAEDKILETLNGHFGDFNLLAEESGEKKNGSDITFVIDPLDGTNNFVLGIPYFSVSIGMMKKEEIVFSCVYNPTLKHTYFAKKGEGAYKMSSSGHVELGVSNKESIENSVVSFVAGYSTMVETRMKFGKKMYEANVSRILDHWCPTLDYCALASGKLEAIINNDDDRHEAIVGKLLITEAGGKIITLEGSEKVSVDENKFIASNSLDLCKKVFEIIK